MRKLGLALTAALVLAGTPSLSVADDGIPDLTGTWSVTLGTTILADGTVNQHPQDYASHVFEITDQTGSVFKATHTLVPKEETKTGTHSGTPLRGQTTNLIGAVDGTGPFVILADIGDTTTFQCNLIDEETMRCLAAEAGDHAVASFMLLKRQQQ
ncbi:hypothetical protein [Bauldia sp.]|uniref:hypothetical protein n=1 Tax=Bauldia sp. TaxID=2575872 RepID=UPI003BAC6A96